MASLTPGVLSKLLETSGDKDARVTGEHRHALLQVIEIVPRFSHDDPWQSKGYFLKLSDSLHSAYVSVPENDAELICSDKVQLGQFVYVTRLDSATPSPVPLVHGLKPVPKRRPCVGNPTDLVSSELLHVGASVNVEFRRHKKGNNNKGGAILKRDEGTSKVKLMKGSPLKSNGGGKVKVVEEGLEMRRLSLDSSRRVWDHSPVSKSGSGTPSSRSKLKSASASPNVCNNESFYLFDTPFCLFFFFPIYCICMVFFCYVPLFVEVFIDEKGVFSVVVESTVLDISVMLNEGPHPFLFVLFKRFYLSVGPRHPVVSADFLGKL